MGTGSLFTRAKTSILNGDIDLNTGTLKVILLSIPPPSLTAVGYYGDIGGELAGGNGYTAGGETLTNVTFTNDTTDNEGVMDADDVSWTNATITARSAIIYQVDELDLDSSILIGALDFGENKTTTNGTFTIQWGSEGVINLN